MGAARTFGTLGVGLQTALGSPTTVPMFTYPKMNGGVNPVKDWGDLPRLGGSMARLGEYAQRARGEGSVTVLANPEGMGVFLKYAMGTETHTPGSTTHVFTMADAYPEYGLTLWDSITTAGVAGTTWKYTDCFIRKLTIDGKSGENLQVTVDYVAFDYDVVATPFTVPDPTGTIGAVTAANRKLDADPRFKFIGSTVKLNPNTSPATDEYHNTESVVFEIDRAPEVRYGPSLTPTTIAPDRLVNLSVGMVFDTDHGAWQFLNNVFSANLTGGGPNQDEPAGAFDIEYGVHPTGHTPAQLKVVSNGYNWQYRGTRPDAAAQPGLAEFELPGIVVSPESGKGGTGSTEVTVTLQSDLTCEYDSAHTA